MRIQLKPHLDCRDISECISRNFEVGSVNDQHIAVVSINDVQSVISSLQQLIRADKTFSTTHQHASDVQVLKNLVQVMKAGVLSPNLKVYMEVA